MTTPEIKPYITQPCQMEKCKYHFIVQPDEDTEFYVTHRLNLICLTCMHHQRLADQYREE